MISILFLLIVGCIFTCKVSCSRSLLDIFMRMPFDMNWYHSIYNERMVKALSEFETNPASVFRDPIISDLVIESIILGLHYGNDSLLKRSCDVIEKIIVFNPPNSFFEQFLIKAFLNYEIPAENVELVLNSLMISFRIFDKYRDEDYNTFPRSCPFNKIDLRSP